MVTPKPTSTIYRSFPFYQSRYISTCPLSFNKNNKQKKEKNNADLAGKHEEGDEVEIEELDTDVEYKELIHRAQLLPGAGHQVFIIQPYIKWGPKKRVLTTPDLMLEEATALIDSLSSWSCVDSIKTPLLSMGKKLLFGTGKLEELQKIVRRNSKISAIFVSVNQLTGLQREYGKIFFFSLRFIPLANFFLFIENYSRLSKYRFSTDTPLFCRYLKNALKRRRLNYKSLLQKSHT